MVGRGDRAKQSLKIIIVIASIRAGKWEGAKQSLEIKSLFVFEEIALRQLIIHPMARNDSIILGYVSRYRSERSNSLRPTEHSERYNS